MGGKCQVTLRNGMNMIYKIKRSRGTSAIVIRWTSTGNKKRSVDSQNVVRLKCVHLHGINTSLNKCILE